MAMGSLGFCSGTTVPGTDTLALEEASAAAASPLHSGLCRFQSALCAGQGSAVQGGGSAVQGTLPDRVSGNPGGGGLEDC